MQNTETCSPIFDCISVILLANLVSRVKNVKGKHAFTNELKEELLNLRDKIEFLRGYL